MKAPEELRAVAIIAEVHLRIDAAQKYGLIDGGPVVDIDRCEKIIQHAHEAGADWTEEEITAAIPDVLEPYLAEAA